MKKEDVMVSKPPHYQSNSGLEVIDVIEAFTDGLTGIEATDTGNIIKYACRWKKKNGVQDLKKIIWYAQHLIAHIEDRKDTNVITTEKTTTRAMMSKNGKIEIEYATLEEAEKMLDTVRKIINQYREIFITDICDLIGADSSYENLKYGWNSIDDFEVISVPGIIVNTYRYILKVSEPKKL